MQSTYIARAAKCTLGGRYAHVTLGRKRMALSSAGVAGYLLGFPSVSAGSCSIRRVLPGSGMMSFRTHSVMSAFSIASILPAPRKTQTAPKAAAPSTSQTVSSAVVGGRIPRYPNRTTARFVPRRAEDFGDGGAYPEIIVAQYPLDMGRREKREDKAKTLAQHVDADGNVQYDAVVKQGRRKDFVVHSNALSLIERDTDEVDDLARPDEETEQAVTDDTKKALAKMMQSAASSGKPKVVEDVRDTVKYIRYTPAETGGVHNSGAKNRIIRMVEAQQDPIAPAKFRATRVPGGPPSPPVPLMHSPTRKVSAEELEDWKIPPCISNWKNPRGYTISLDKRLAADGRGLQEVTINDKFAKLSESLYIAERVSRREIEERARVQEQQLRKKKEEKEEELRKLAQEARRARMSTTTSGMDDRADTMLGVPTADGGGDNHADEDEDDTGRAERDAIREERRREREREIRMRSSSSLKRDRDRDVSEKIALGEKVASGGENVDSRLYNMGSSAGGMGTGLMDDESYNLYDKPLFTDRGTSLYKARVGDTELYGGDDVQKIMSTSRFKPDQAFAGTEASASEQSRREGPVQFEKEEEDDPFGLGQFLSTEVKGGGKALQGIGKSGFMAANAGGSSASELAPSSKRSKIAFESSSSSKR